VREGGEEPTEEREKTFFLNWRMFFGNWSEEKDKRKTIDAHGLRQRG
jgi:hypothetical protein